MESNIPLSKNSISTRLVYRYKGKAKKGFPGPNIPSNTKSPLLRLNTICPYYTMFPLSFPLRHLSRANKDDWILDPFCGRGTTLFASRVLGLRCMGIDSNPAAATIAAAKLSNASAKSVINLVHEILAENKKPDCVPSGEFWKFCYHPQTLIDICMLRERLLKKCGSAEEITLRALLMGILHGPLLKGKPTYLSNQMPRTYATKPDAAVRFWKRRGLTVPPYVDVTDAVTRRAKYTLSETPHPAKGAVYLGDARLTNTLLPKGRRFNWIITSPPYLKMQTYGPDQWVRNWFLGGNSSVEYRQNGQLSHRTEQFAEDLSAVWREIAKLCVPGARLIVRFGRLPSVSVNAEETLAESLELSGMRWKIEKWEDAGSANGGRRQSEQFGSTRKNATREIDLHARLEV